MEVSMGSAVVNVGVRKADVKVDAPPRETIPMLVLHLYMAAQIAEVIRVESTG